MTRRQLLTLVAAVLGSGMAMLDSSIVNVALPSIERNLGGGLSAQQWIVNGYLLTLGSFILIGGSLGDVLGRRRIFVIGVTGFGICSALCAAAPSIGFLLGARAAQGVLAALLTPSSLAAIVEAFPGDRRGSAVGTWTAWTGIAMIVGPLVGGWIVGIASWRWIFLINVPLAALTVTLIRMAVSQTSQRATRRIDSPGAALCVVGLTGVVFALIEEPHFGWGSPTIFGSLAIGVIALVAFGRWEHSAPDPMVKLELFGRRNFSVTNLATFTIYGGISIMGFFLVLFLQQDAGYTALKSGFTTLPTTLVMFALSRRFGTLADRFGPRLLMAAGPLIAAVGVLYLARAHPPVSYFTNLLPGILVFALGLSITVAPLTATVLAGADETDAGIASAINNAVARVAGLVGISVVSVLVAGDLPHHVFAHNAGSTHAFHVTMFLCACLLAAGGIASALGIVNPERPVSAGPSASGSLTVVPEPLVSKR